MPTDILRIRTVDPKSNVKDNTQKYFERNNNGSWMVPPGLRRGNFIIKDLRYKHIKRDHRNDPAMWLCGGTLENGNESKSVNWDFSMSGVGAARYSGKC